MDPLIKSQRTTLSRLRSVAGPPSSELDLSKFLSDIFSLHFIRCIVPPTPLDREGAGGGSGSVARALADRYAPSTAFSKVLVASLRSNSSYIILKMEGGRVVTFGRGLDQNQWARR